MRVLIFGTCYADTPEKLALLRQWDEVNGLLNKHCHILLVDSNSLGGEHSFNATVLQFWDNIGHLARGGQDGWGRAFCAGLQYAIEHDYDYVVHIEGDSLCKLDVMHVCQQMHKHRETALSVPVIGTLRKEKDWVETGLMFFDVEFIKQRGLIEAYNWRDGAAKNYPNTPEFVISELLGSDLRLISWKTIRDDRNQLTVDNVKEYDWITHTTPEVYDAFAKFIKSLDHPHQWYGGRTYAQHGDDLAIINIFGCLRIAQPSYLDIGAHHPVELSNTALLYQRGSRGINVEANPALIENFRRLRPEDKNICAAVVGSAGAGFVKLNRVNETSGINSLLPIKGHGTTDTVEIPSTTANEIVDKFAAGKWPDLLTIDAEGLDLEILRSIEYQRGGPKVICAEAVSQNGDVATELRELMSANGYAVHSWAGSNLLFIRAELAAMCK